MLPSPGSGTAEREISGGVYAMAAYRRSFEKQLFMLQLVAPAALVMVLFQIVPIFVGAEASFQDWALYDPARTWVGWKHYVDVITDPYFYGLVLPNTFMFMTAAVAMELIAGLALALLLNRTFRGHYVVRTCLLLPLMVAPVVAAMMLRWMFNDQFGIINVIMESLGLEPVPWLAQRWTAFGIILLADFWLWTPWFMILLLAGLQSLPVAPFEAAAIDGASKWRVFRYLTLPMLRPIIGVCIVIRAIDAFRVFDQVWVISGGGPARSTETFSVYAYMEAFQNLDFGKGSAAAMIGGMIILVFGLALYGAVNRLIRVPR
jgi:multiple sugar transport system permease protein